jgi:PAS domain S-box-containing protein
VGSNAETRLQGAGPNGGLRAAGPWATVGLIGALALAYFMAGRLGLGLTPELAGSAPVWPPTGLALAGLLVFGYRLAPGVFLGAYLVNLAAASSVIAASVGAAGNTLEAIAGAWLINRFAHGVNFFQQPFDVFKFAVLAGLAGLFSHPIGATDLTSHYQAVFAGGLSNAFAWWLGAMVNVLMVAPGLVLWILQPRPCWSGLQTVELVLLLLLQLVAAAAVFGGLFPASTRGYLLPYLCLPFPLWAAFRFGPRETAIAVPVLGAAALWGTLHGYGVFAQAEPGKALLAYQGFMGFNCIMALAVAAVVAQRRQAEAEMRQAGEELERRVRQRTEALSSEATERKRAEETTHKARAYAERLIQTANVMIIGLDRAGCIQVFNEAAEKITGYTRQELAGKNWFEVLVPREAYPTVWREFNRLLAGGSHLPHTFENPILTKAGGERFISWRNNEVLEGGEVVGTISFGIDVTEQRQAEEAVRRTQEELEKRVRERTAALSEANRALEGEMAQRRNAEADRLQLLRRLEEAQETERGRISRELHDQLGQAMTALKLGLQLVRKQGPFPPPTEQCVNQLEALADGMMRDLHRLAWELRPAALDDFGLDMALGRYAEEWAEQSGVKVDFHSKGLEERLPRELETMLYRVTQEALTNVLRHAQAGRVSVLLERRPELVSLIVEDNGRGFDSEVVLTAPSTHGKLGLLGMQERVVLAGGTIELESTPGVGTTVFVRIPLPAVTA